MAISAMQNCLRVYESLKIDEVRAMRQQFPMNLRGKQIGHILGFIPGALYGQAALQGMSRAYQGVLEEANQRIAEFRGYDACILGYDPTYSTFGSSSCGFAGGSSIETGFDMGLSYRLSAPLIRRSLY